jgi:hypothetical protein
MLVWFFDIQAADRSRVKRVVERSKSIAAATATGRRR